MSQSQTWREALGLGISGIAPWIGGLIPGTGIFGPIVAGAVGTAAGVAIGRNREDRLKALVVGGVSAAAATTATAVTARITGNNPTKSSLLGNIGDLLHIGSPAASAIGKGITGAAPQGSSGGGNSGQQQWNQSPLAGILGGGNAQQGQASPGGAGSWLEQVLGGNPGAQTPSTPAAAPSNLPLILAAAGIAFAVAKAA